MALQFETISALFQATGVGPSITVPAPAGLVAGDFLFAIGAVYAEPAVITPPAGWTKHDEQSIPGFPTGFLASKIATAADVAAGSFLFSQTLGAAAWTVGIYRYSGASGFDSFKAAVVGGVSTTLSQATNIVTVADNVQVIQAIQSVFATAEPTSVTDPGVNTRRAFVGGPNDPGAANPFALYYTEDDVVTPPGTHSAHLPKAIANGASGAKTSMNYAVGIAPLLPGGTDVAPPQDKSGKIITKAEVLAIREQAKIAGARIKLKFDPRTRR